MTRAYRYGPIAIVASFDIPELPDASASSPGDTCVRVDEIERLDFDGVEWYHEWRTADDDVWVSFGRTCEGYALRFPRMADFALTSELRILVSRRHASESTVRHLLLDQVLPLALSQCGMTVLHAAAVMDDDSALGFMGATGHGKSTMTASFAANGLCAMTDDTLIVTADDGALIAYPSYPSIRVWEDSANAVAGGCAARAPRVSDYNDKVRVDAAAGLIFAEKPAPLRALYVLQPDDTCAAPCLEELPPRERAIAIVRHAFVLDGACAAASRARFDVLTRLASEIPVRRLRYRQSFDSLPSVQQLILDP